MWTHFNDMHSGGGTKVEGIGDIYIEAPRQEAASVFYVLFGRNPNRVTCTCCGPDYSFDDYETLEEASGFERGCAHEDGKWQEKQGTWGTYQSLQEYLKQPSVKVVRKEEILDSQRYRDVPEQGYVWRD